MDAIISLIVFAGIVVILRPRSKLKLKEMIYLIIIFIAMGLVVKAIIFGLGI